MDQISYIPGLGFRPVELITLRNQYGDKLELIVGDDSPLEGKIPPGIDAYKLTVDPYDGTATDDQFVPASGRFIPSEPVDPVTPCCIWTGPGDPLPPLASVPLMASGDFLAALVLLPIILKAGAWLWRAIGLFGDWFTAERGTGPDQNGWV